MLEAGTVICPVCGELFTESTYGVSDSKTRLVLHREKKLGLFDGKYYVEPMGVGTDSKNTYTLVTSREALVDGVPESIEVSVNDSAPQVYYRCCPKCSTMTRIPATWGKLPSFVIMATGAGGAGKTSLLTAMAVMDNLAVLARAKYPQRIKPLDLECVVGVRGPDHTARESIGATKVFQLLAAGGDGREQPVANVLIRDFAGEVFTDPQDADHPVNRFTGSEGRYPGPDGIIFVHSALQQEQEMLKVFECVQDKLGDRWPPVALVVSHVDELDNWTRPANDNTPVPILDKNTFPPCHQKLLHENYYARERLIPRILLQNGLVRSQYAMFSEDLRLLGDNSMGFLVKSCSLGAGNVVRMEEPINVMDPLLWLLNTLGLLDLRGDEL